MDTMSSWPMAALDRARGGTSWVFGGLRSLECLGKRYYMERAQNGHQVRWLLWDDGMCGLGIFANVSGIEDYVTSRASTAIESGEGT